MAFTFKPEELFSKGIVYAEFFDPATDDLLGYFGTLPISRLPVL